MRLFGLIILIIILFAMYKSKEIATYLATQKAANDYNRLREEQAVVKAIEGKQYRDWEVKANKMLDPANLFGFRG